MDNALITLFEPMFHTPFVTGLCLSVLLPMLGIYLRLRDEWLAALGLAQMSAAAALVGYSMGIPIYIAGPLGGIAMAFVKFFSSGNNTAYALMIISGWALTFLIAANTTLGESLGHALVDGQLYFIQKEQGIATGILLVCGALILYRLSGYLLRARLFPHYEQLNEKLSYRWHLSFDVLVAIAMGIATASIGLMTAFAMVFIPAWLAFRISPSWKAATWIAICFNVLAYSLGFVLAIILDQPYGPAQVTVHLLVAMLVLAAFQLKAKKERSAHA